MHILRTAICAVIAALLAACSVQPEPISHSEQLRILQAHLAKMQHHSKLTKPVTLADAIAYTVAFNLDHKVKQAEISLANGDLTIAKIQMLPALNAGADYSRRNNEAQQLLQASDGSLVDNESSVTPRNQLTANIGMSWNILDFGVSYLAAKEQANRVLIAEQQRQRQLQELTSRAIVAYWRAYSAQQMKKDIKHLRENLALVRSRSDQLIKEDVVSKQDELAFQEVLVKSERRLNTLNLAANKALQELVNLMGLAPGTKLTLAKPTKKLLTLPEVNSSLEQLDAVALSHRQELREASYNVNIAKIGVRKSILELLPGLNFGYSYNYDRNRFLKHDEWLTVDVNMSWNLIRLFTAGTVHKVASSKVDYQKLNRMALTAAILTQVRLAYLDYLYQKRDYALATKEADIAKQLYTIAYNHLVAKAGSKREMIRRLVINLNAQLSRDQSFADAQDALGRLYLSTGMSLVPGIDAKQDFSQHVKPLAKHINKQLRAKKYHNFSARIETIYQKLIKSAA